RRPRVVVPRCSRSRRLADCPDCGPHNRRAVDATCGGAASTRSTSAPGSASSSCTIFSFPHWASPSTPRLSPRWDQAPERRIFEPHPPNADALEAVLVHQGQLSSQRVAALNPQLVVDPVSVITEVHLLFRRVIGRGRAVLLRQD